MRVCETPSGHGGGSDAFLPERLGRFHGEMGAVPCICQEQKPCMLRTELAQSVLGEEKKEKEAVPVLQGKVEVALIPQGWG